MVQALYYCKPFRDCALHYNHPHSSTKQVVIEEGVKLDQIRIERKADKPSSSNNQTAANQTRSTPGPNTRSTPLNQTRSFTGMSGLSTASPFSPTKSMPVPKRGELDAPLEGSIQGAVQVDSSTKKDVDVWAGTIIESIAAGLHLHPSNDTLLDSLQTLFSAISSQKRQVGVIGPKQFITKLKQSNGEFPSFVCKSRLLTTLPLMDE